MNRIGVQYSLASAAIAIGVMAIGRVMVGSDGVSGVVWGTVAGLSVQVAVFWVLFVGLFPRQMGLAHGLGAVIRFAAVAAMALLGPTMLAVDAAPTLFSMVACLFGTTLLEPLFLKRFAAAGDPGARAMQTQS